MKRLIISTLALATGLGPMLATPAFAQYYGDRDDQYHRDRDRDYDRDRDRDRDGDRDRDWRRHHRGDYRGDRWDYRQHNGYFYGGRWYYGPPPSYYYGRPGFSLGYHSWRRGDRLPGYYRDRYREVDYRYYRLRPPPYGYHYVRDDRGEILLVGIATGVILGAILSDHGRY